MKVIPSDSLLFLLLLLVLGNCYFRGSATGLVVVRQWGLPGDIPLATAPNQQPNLRQPIIRKRIAALPSRCGAGRT